MTKKLFDVLGRRSVDLAPKPATTYSKARQSVFVERMATTRAIQNITSADPYRPKASNIRAGADHSHIGSKGQPC